MNLDGNKHKLCRVKVIEDLIKLAVFIKERSLGTPRDISLFNGYWPQEDREMLNA